MLATRSVRRLALTGALLLPSFAFAGLDGSSSFSKPSDALTLTPSVVSTTSTDAQAATSDASSKATADAPQMMDAAPPPEAPNVHGFFNSPFKTGYLTPRGLYVQNSGISWQPVVGLVFPGLGDIGPVKGLTFVGGIWNAVDTYEAKSNPRGGAWDEMDVFASFSGTVAKDFGLNLTYGAWNFPQSTGPHTEHNIDLKITYSDKWFGDVTINPYLDCWWAVSGSSTVVLGRKGGTGYFEPGIVPTYTYKGIASYPMTFTFPTYISIGPSTYWDASKKIDNGSFGVFSTGVNVSVPMAFIPTKYGFWHADAGLTYDYLINDALLQAGTIVSGNTDRNCFVGSVGFGVNF